MEKSCGLAGMCYDCKNEEKSVTLKLEQSNLDQPMASCREEIAGSQFHWKIPALSSSCTHLSEGLKVLLLPCAVIQ